jgi:murein DD-endopeptidase MepM/ murein hydrolase activator NlpD
MVPAADARGAWEHVAASPYVMAEATKGGVEGMRSARAYAVVAVVLVMAASLGAVSLAWGDPGAKSTSSGTHPEPFPAGGGGAKQTPQGKQTPLLMRVLDPPEPVKGTDGKYHLVYELVLTNSSPGTATVQSIKTIDPKSGEVVDSLGHAEVAARTLLLGDISGATPERIGSGRVALVLLDATFEDLKDVPKALEHRVKTSFEIPAGFGSNLFPKETTDVGGATGVLNKKPVTISPPVRGKNWVAVNGCCGASPHRGAMLAIDQKLLAAERYGIDWIQADEEGRILLPDENSKLTDFPAYGDPVLAVANGKVVDVVKGLPDVEPGVLDQDNTLKEAGGNHVILDIGGGRYAFYAHLKPGSITVEEGDPVKRGQRIARLGNSGNTNFPHLHFHVMDAPLPLGADHNLPYVFDSFVYQGHYEDGLTPILLDTPEPREDELPLDRSLVSFPAP